MAKKKEQIVVDKDFDPEKCEFKTMADFDMYNAWARANKIPVKVPTEEFYKEKIKVKFQRMDQPENVLKFRVRNREISWDGQLKPGCTYDLPAPVIKHLNKLSIPKFEEVQINDGSGTRTETKQTGEINRFACLHV